MKIKNIIICFLFVGLAVFQSTLPILIAEESKKEPAGKKIESKNKHAVSLAGMPVYKPPRRGAPNGRVGGGTRGNESELPFLAALVPEHVGLTVKNQPSLYWRLSKPADCAMEFALIDKHSIQPLLEKRFEPPVQAGIHCLRMDNHEVSLEIGKEYKWYVALILDPEHRSKDIIAGGIIEYVKLPETTQIKLKEISKEKTANIYAENGIWYEALSTISELIEADLGNFLLLKKRDSLLEQVGLSEVARYEKDTN